jgi:hypothetical protein
MKKLTLEQALKTPNIAFEVKPHQAERVITAFNLNRADIPDIRYARTNSKGLYEGWYTNSAPKDEWFNQAYTSIMVEIIEEESDAFNSQQEVWQWLSSNEGNKCLWDNKVIIGFKDSILWNFSRNIISNLNTSNSSEFTKYKEPEYITVNGFQVPKPIKELNEFKLANLLIEEGIHSNSENAYIHAQAMLGYVDL